MEEDLDITRNIRKLIENRIINPKFANNLEVIKSLGVSERYFYSLCVSMRIDNRELAKQRKKAAKLLKDGNNIN